MRQNNLFNITNEEQRKIIKGHSEYLFYKWMLWSFTIKGKVLFKDVLEMRKKYKIDN